MLYIACHILIIIGCFVAYLYYPISGIVLAILETLLLILSPLFAFYAKRKIITQWMQFYRNTYSLAINPKEARKAKIHGSDLSDYLFCFGIPFKYLILRPEAITLGEGRSLKIDSTLTAKGADQQTITAWVPPLNPCGSRIYETAGMDMVDALLFLKFSDRRDFGLVFLDSFKEGDFIMAVGIFQKSDGSIAQLYGNKNYNFKTMHEGRWVVSYYRTEYYTSSLAEGTQTYYTHTYTSSYPASYNIGRHSMPYRS